MNKDIITDLVNKGMSTRQIALNLNISQSNVRYWLNKFDLKTNLLYNGILHHLLM